MKKKNAVTDVPVEQKTLINQLTGEVYEIKIEDEEKKQELVKQEMNVMLTDDVYEMFNMLDYYQEQVETWKFKAKDKIKELFKANGIKSFKNDYIEITLIEESVRRSVDTKKLKDAGLYDEFSKETKVAESLRVKLKGDRD